MFHVLIADGSGARLYEYTGGNGALRELREFVNPQAHMHERDLVSSRPGRALNRMSGQHQTYAPGTSAKETSMQRWLQSLAKALGGEVRRRRSEGLVVVASPRLLGSLQPAMSAALQAKVCSTVRLNLAGQPIGAVTKRLQPQLRRLAARAPAASDAMQKRLATGASRVRTTPTARTR